MARSYIRNVGTGSIYNESGEIMAGQVIYVAGSAMPSGYLECNGATVSRTTYATLFEAIGSTYGAGDGSTTFALPDLRGEFMRGADRGRGVDAGRAIGSAQGDAIRNIAGNMGASIGNAGASGAVAVDVMNPNSASANPGGEYAYPTRNFDASRVVPTAAENRPRNVAMIAAIKYS